MIVDLVRNDLGRVCRPGTVRVTALAEVRPHAGVWHMVSEVEGELRPDVGDAGLLRATFPPGSVTGAPKLAALDVIAELESTGREAYTGAIGFASPLAGLELSVAIRTFEVRGERIWLGAGGGIVADSVGEDEAREAAAKAAPLLAAIGASPPAPGVAPRPRRAAPARRRGRSRGPIPRPGCTRRSSSRTARRRTSTPTSRAWRRASPSSTGSRPADDLAARVRSAARGHERARLRIDALPGEEATLTVTPLGAIAPVRPAPRRRCPAGSARTSGATARLLESHERDDPATRPAPARRRRLRARGEPRDRRRARRVRRAAHPAGRRPHPARRDRGARRGAAAARSRSPTSTRPPRSTSRARLRGLSPAARTPAA